VQPIAQAVLGSWSIPPTATFALALTFLTYLRGAWLLRSAGYPFLPAWRIGSFALGLFALWFALASPLDTFSPFVLTSHMLQHMTLMMVASPLILLGEPLIPILRGMPRFAAREFAGPFLNWPAAQRAGLALTNPVAALLLMGAAMFLWHVPGPYELALRSSSWHLVEHACFFFASIVFWWPVVQPWPSHEQWPRWAMVPYLVIADLQNTVLSAVLVFSDKLLYPSYAAAPSLFGLTPREDQAAAGAIMWVVGSLAFIVPTVLIAVRCLSRRKTAMLAPAVRRNEAPPIERAVSVSSQHFSFDGMLGSRLTTRSIEVCSFLMLFVLTASGFVVMSRLSSGDDDQQLRVSTVSGPFLVSVYGPPGDIAVGPARFAVLVQERANQRVLLDSDVSLSLRKTNHDGAEPAKAQAARADENKLLFSADFDLDTAGPWVLDVAVRQASEETAISTPIDVLRPEAGFSLPWSYVLVVLVSVLLGTTYLWRHRSRKPSGAVAAAS
jgi:putative membrane protein